MRRNKLMAMGLAGLMIVTTAMPVFADTTSEPASGTVSGTGSIEGYVDKDVFTVTLPTTADVNFSIDPQELKLAVDSTYDVDGATATKGYGAKVLFTDANSKAVTKSKDITIVNKSTFDVDVSVDATVSGLKTDEYEIALVDDATTESDPAISLDITDSTNTLTGTTEGTPVTGTAQKLTGTDTFSYSIDVSDDVDDAYEVTGTTGNYTYGLKSDVSSVAFNEITLNIAGKVNTNADWTDFNKASTKSLKVDVAYSVTKHVDEAAPSVKNTSLTWASGSDAVIDYSLGKGSLAATKVTAIKYVNGSGATVNLATSNYTDDGSKITIKTSFVNALISSGATTKKFTVVFDDSSTTNVEVTFATN